MIFNNEVIQSLGMTLVHSLWQGLVVLVLVMFALLLAGKSNARLRYACLVSGLMLLLAGFMATWCILYLRNKWTLPVDKYATPVHSQIPGLADSTSQFMDTTSISLSVHRFLESSYPVLAMGWILGFLFMAVRMTGGLYLSQRIIKREVFLPDLFLQKIFIKTRTRMMVPAMIQLRLTARKISPMVIGLLKPVVILPASVLSGLNAEQLEAILVHELAHIRRYDHVAMIIQSIATQVLFFHPFAWYLSAEINRERENCCDDLVIKLFPNPINYIKALTMMQEFHICQTIPANALIGRTKSLLGRITRILKPETNQTPVNRIALVLMLLITLGIVAVTIATTGNSGSKKSMALVFSDKAVKSVNTPDTTKKKVEQKVVIQEESFVQDDKKKEKDIADARHNLEKAQRELEKARQELEKARQEVERAQQQLRKHDLSSKDGEIRPNMPDLPDWEDFRFAFKYDGPEHMRNLQEELKGAQEMSKHIRQEDLDRFREVWRRSGEEMKKAMEEFFKSRNDSGMFFHSPHPFLHVPPIPPNCPQVPPHIPHTDLRELPDLEILLPEGEPLNEFHPMESIPDEPEKSSTLDSKLREVEEGNE